jgi:Zn-dependent protease
MFETGYLTLFRFGRQRIPVRAHWSLPLGAWFFCGFHWAPVAWLTFALLILAHELGHAFMVRVAGAHVLGVDLTVFGGLCTWQGHTNRFQRAYIAAGGVLAQAVIFVAATMVQARRLALFGAYTPIVLDVLISDNLWIAMINLLPVAPLDGAKAWALLPLLPKRVRLWWLERRMQRDRRRARRNYN